MTPPAATAAGRTAVPRVPRRVSGPARPHPRPRPRPVPAPPSLGERVAGRARVLSDAPLLDRLIHGRTWIAIVAVALLGIVFMQVSLLKLNAGIGVDVKRAQVLERGNAELRAQVSRLQSGGRIQEFAGGLGLVMPSANGFLYVTAGRPGDAERAARAIRPPDPVEQLPAPGTLAAAATTATTATTAAAQPATTPPASGTVPPATATTTTTTTAPTASPTATPPAGGTTQAAPAAVGGTPPATTATPSGQP